MYFLSIFLIINFIINITYKIELLIETCFTYLKGLSNNEWLLNDLTKKYFCIIIIKSSFANQNIWIKNGNYFDRHQHYKKDLNSSGHKKFGMQDFCYDFLLRALIVRSKKETS